MSTVESRGQFVTAPMLSGSTAALLRIDRPTGVTKRVVWRYAVPLTIVHVLSLLALAPWFFSWTGVAIWFVGVYFYGAFGINIGYHRLLTHRSFKCPLWLEHCMVFVALCCMEDAPASWVATHRQHHNETDEQPDPHSPLVGFFWAHVGWLLVENVDVRCLNAYERYARDVLKDPFYMRLQRSLLPVWIYLGHALAYYLAGAGFVLATGGSGAAAFQFGMSLLVWGVFFRTVCVWHISWSVNSLTHMFGYRNYETAENSRNNWLVAFLASGEGWHNNHHIDPASACNHHRWWEVDPMWMIIRGLEMVGLATHVVRPRHIRAAGRIAASNAASN
jgi:stearoyl-CoA desaturase (delta-9 desaturase)